MPLRKTPSPRQPAKKPGKTPATKAPAANDGAAKSRTPRPRVKRTGAVTPDERQRFIAEAAYFKAERRGFAGGGELEDWIEAEAEIDSLLDSRGAG